MNSNITSGFLIALDIFIIIIIFNTPIYNRLLYLAGSKYAKLILMLIMIYVHNLAIDLGVKITNKQCQLKDSAIITFIVASILIVFFILDIIPRTNYMLSTFNPYVLAMIVAFVASVPVFIWKGFGKKMIMGDC